MTLLPKPGTLARHRAASAIGSALLMAATLTASTALAQAPDANSSAPAQQMAPQTIPQAAPEVAPTTAPNNTSPAEPSSNAGAPDTSAAEQPAAAAAGAEPAATPVTTADPQGSRSDLPHDLSPWGMFMAADWVVKGVMTGLALASLITWTIWVAKTLELAGARRRALSALKIIRASRTLPEAIDAAGKRGGPAVLMLRAAAEEMQLSEAALDHAGGDGVKERVGSVLSRIEAYAGRRMSRGTGALATIGSTAPFVGLFGTVWGIMNSFIGISQAHTTNLAVVAPGIAEALLATAIGLVAAIPAVVIYNVFARSVTGYRQLLADAAAGVERLVSRDLDFRKLPPGRKAPVSLVAGG